jgi:hypothetical protein
MSIIKNSNIRFSKLPTDTYKHIISFLNSPLIDDIYNPKNNIYIHLGIYDKLKENGSLIRKIVNPTIEICHLVIKDYPHFAKYIPQEILVLLFQDVSPECISYIQPEYQSEEIVLSVFRRDIKLIKRVHCDKITEKINDEIINYLCENKLCKKREYTINLDNGEIETLNVYFCSLFDNSFNLCNYINRRILDFRFNRFYYEYYRCIDYIDNNNDTLNSSMKIKNKKRLLQQQKEKKQFNKIKIRG